MSSEFPLSCIDMTHGTESRRSRSFGLRTVFAATVLAPLALVGIAVFWVGGLAVERAVQQRLEEDVELVARAIQLPLSRALSDGEATQLYDALRSAFQIRRLYGAHVYDADGVLVAEVGPGPAEAAVEGATTDRAVEQGGEYGLVGGRRVYSYFVPLTSPGGRIEGLLQVTRRRSDIEATVRRVRVQSAGMFGLAWLLMAGLVLVAHHRMIGLHFGRLSGAMARVEEGERGEGRARVEETGPREIAKMAGAFNRMVAGVERAESEVAARRAREKELQKRIRRNEKLAAIGRLAGGVAHELGAPLSVIEGTAQRLARRGAEEAASGDAIRVEVRRMERVVRQLLEFGARESGDERPVSARSVVVSAAGAIRADIEGEGASLEVVAGVAGDAGSPPGAGQAGEIVSGPDPLIRGDARRLEAALVHLLRNAGQSAGRGGSVRLSVEASGACVRFVVDDSGPGVADDVLGRIFEPFFTTKAVGQGSGLGLAVVHAVAEEHGGTVDVEESPLGGARFVLSALRDGAADA
jgi:two-component system, NtrC family, sensor kinase